jgi:hypothetical protein
MCPKHGTDFLEYKCRYCCSVAVFFCFGTTHFCNACHDDFQRVTNIPRLELPSCPAGMYTELWACNTCSWEWNPIVEMQLLAERQDNPAILNPFEGGFVCHDVYILVLKRKCKLYYMIRLEMNSQLMKWVTKLQFSSSLNKFCWVLQAQNVIIFSPIHLMTQHISFSITVLLWYENSEWQLSKMFPQQKSVYVFPAHTVHPIHCNIACAAVRIVYYLCNVYIYLWRQKILKILFEILRRWLYR